MWDELVADWDVVVSDCVVECCGCGQELGEC